MHDDALASVNLLAARRQIASPEPRVGTYGERHLMALGMLSRIRATIVGLDRCLPLVASRTADGSRRLRSAAAVTKSVTM